ncbi:leucine-rich repeat domain-containing protein [Candidatus Bathyarchaeota archaeon]|nr:leucine-rich repeat domain-containing protein [Candidatus Bathyarchaeota archaeon]
MFGAGAGRGQPLNGQSGRNMQQMLYGFQQPHASHQHGPAQHHQGGQPDPNAHNGSNPNLLSHPQNYSTLTNAHPYSTTPMQNGHAATPGGGQGGVMTEHWAKQVRMLKDSERANVAMIDQNQPHYYARLKASENKGIGLPPQPEVVNGDGEDMRRPTGNDKLPPRQDWHNLDLSGQGLRNLSPSLFKYEFLRELYIASNKLTRLSPAIGRLRHLTHLDASHNEISELPAELSMCTYLRHLLLFHNRLRTLPHELGSLHMLETLGIEGNTHFAPDFRTEISERGTKSLVTYLRENASGVYPHFFRWQPKTNRLV